MQAVRSLNPPGRFLDKDPDTGLWNDIGHKKAIGYARQLVDFDYFEKLEATWGSAIRALEVYGFKTLIDEALGVLYAKPAAL